MERQSNDELLDARKELIKVASHYFLADIYFL
jgi:hypothetical protein